MSTNPGLLCRRPPSRIGTATAGGGFSGGRGDSLGRLQLPARFLQMVGQGRQVRLVRWTPPLASRAESCKAGIGYLGGAFSHDRCPAVTV
jgi:hypothetical protein